MSHDDQQREGRNRSCGLELRRAIERTQNRFNDDQARTTRLANLLLRKVHVLVGQHPANLSC